VHIFSASSLFIASGNRLASGVFSVGVVNKCCWKFSSLWKKKAIEESGITFKRLQFGCSYYGFIKIGCKSNCFQLPYEASLGGNEIIAEYVNFYGLFFAFLVEYMYQPSNSFLSCL
jgi:hypothetical protein